MECPSEHLCPWSHKRQNQLSSTLRVQKSRSTRHCSRSHSITNLLSLKELVGYCLSFESIKGVAKRVQVLGSTCVHSNMNLNRRRCGGMVSQSLWEPGSIPIMYLRNYKYSNRVATFNWYKCESSISLNWFLLFEV